MKPRVLSSSGESLPLEDEVRSLLDAHGSGFIHITGPAGSGKTTALRHLAAVLPPDCTRFIDEGPPTQVSDSRGNLVVYVSRNAWSGSCLASYSLAPWGEDEWIEYLLAMHRERCGSVVKRLRVATGPHLLPPLPLLWRVILDEMAADETVAGVRAAIRRFVARQAADPKVRQALRRGCLELVLPAGPTPRSPEPALGGVRYSLDLWRLLRYEGVQLLLAAEQIVADLRDRLACQYLEWHLPPALVRETAALAATVPEALEHLRKVAAGPGAGVPAELQPMAASILHATDTGWVPAGERPNLYGAYLAQAAWPYVRLPDANLQHADLNGAYLHEAVLDRVRADRVNLSKARLPGASLRGFFAPGADLTDADLSLVKAEKAFFGKAVLKGVNLETAMLRGASFADACLEGACLVEADLSGAVLRGADITDADFTAANLEEATLAGLCLRKSTFTGARFSGAILTGCDLEYLQLPAADFRLANLTGAYLTGSWMPDGNFENACLRSAGLADVNWAGACLRGADLTGASFHAGSSRSGLVFSPIASEGSRTGFYTDDSEEQYFKCPEEVRKANLCGADLRGAVLTNVDFYLVDLRGALFDPEQEQHFRRCRAILEARV